jgi:hypothetical protein
MSRSVLRPAILMLGSLAVLALLVNPTSAEIQKMVAMCQGQNLCPWYKAVVSPPKGWAEDKDFGGAHFITALFPDKAQLGPVAPVIYVQVSLHRDDQTLDENITQNQSIWRKSEPAAKITPMADSLRSDGRAPFKVFLYENPTHPKQAFEMMAFTLEKQPDGSHYIITVVDTASNRKGIDGSHDAYMAVLGQL